MKNNAFVFYGLLSFLIFIGIGYYFDFGKNPHIFTVKSKHAETNKNNHQAKQPELCDRIGVLKRCNDLIAENNARSCLNLSDRFFEKCGDYDQLHNYRNTAARRISEWKIALESANKLIELYPFSPNPHFIRAGTHKEMGDYRSAITDYEQTLALMPGEIQSPFELVNLYERSGQPCRGISYLEQFSYYHPDVSNNAENILKSLYKNPACSDMQGSGKATIKISKNGLTIQLNTTINKKHNGNFIVDTGASFVVLSKKFANRMQLHYLDWPTIISQTAKGTAEGRHGFIDAVAVQGVEAKHIEVVVLDDLGPIDGLLGLSFLSRFKIEMDAAQGYLKLTSK
ncbi:retropepsin-like aspartic protease [Methylovulum psychrotolerans]|uniref:retropepsin-like aspartic protease n=1 Tax=Methylovulum psychrotolerans TaxID=1704499 RepID=UPI0014748C40|nr:retropepsin-like aspartic protease [Methylovulum psychrotolerans]